MSEDAQRRLAAIVAADVVGYSRLMSADETGTLAALRAHRATLVDPLIAHHGGRIVKTMGDGLLLEFPSIVAAVEFATSAQTGIVEQNRTVADDRAIRLRIGVHLGDVIIDGDDILGSGVNIAARIEALAEPDGVCLSDDAYRLVRDRGRLAWEDGGTHAVKNIPRPIQIWHWRPAVLPAAASAPVTLVREAAKAPEKPSIAVLPFDNMSGDPEQEHFADGMTEDLITDLSKISGLFVVARNSSFVFKGKAVDIREAARQLGVHYVVEGSVRKAGPRVRINVQLIEAASGGHVWAERYDGRLEDVFELQDEVGAKVVEALSVRLSGDESERLRRVHTQNLEAYELYVRAKATPYPPVPARIGTARQMFEQVIAIDPAFAGGYAGVSWMISLSALFANADLDALAGQAQALARKAVALDDSFGGSHIALCLALLCGRRHVEAIAAVDEAIARQPSDADAHAFRALTLGLAGRPERAIEPIERALRLNPQFVNGPYLNLRGMIFGMMQDHVNCVRSFEENIARHGPVGPPVLVWGAAACLALGRRDEADRFAGQLRAGFPGFELATWNFLKLMEPPEVRERVYELMRNAGVPE